MKNEIFEGSNSFDFYKVQLNKLIKKSELLESDSDQLTAKAIFENTTESFNETFGELFMKAKTYNE
ncbi:MAG: hypothetical protein AD073_000263 [Mycoplasmataceae bacterium]|nr:MAG: hypothetical protein AD073_000263 [Mycoplasmataceae bacterium]